MSDEAHTKTKDRSPNFPFISLSAAVRRAQEFYKEEKRSAAPFSVAAKHWNYSPLSSGALQTVGALKNYGLMTDEGSGSQRKLLLTEMALRILLDARPDSSERDAYLRQAALAPSVATDVYAKWPETLPSDANLYHYLVFDRKFSESSAQKVVKILKENEAFTGSSRVVISSSPEEDMTDSESGLVHMDTQANNVLSGSKRAVVPALQGDLQMVKAPSGNYVKIQFAGEPTLEDYEFLKRYVAFQISEFAPNVPTPKDS
jgi:hypothetical protein